MPADWCIKLVNSQHSGGFFGWNLESPLAGPEPENGSSEEVRFRGWLLCQGGPGRISIFHSGALVAERDVDLPRPDVARAHAASPTTRGSMERCGFDVSVPRLLGPYRLEVRSSPAWEGEPSMMAFDVIDRRGGPYAVVGEGGHLFLGGDSNDSIGQFTTSRRLPEHSLKAWTATFNSMVDWEDELSLRMAFLVAPAKEEILPASFPLPRARRTILDDFRKHFGGKAIVPIHELRAQKQFTYCETDTHWTDYGATIAARAILKHWKIGQEAEAALPQEFRVHQRQGDLGVKLHPRRASYELIFSGDVDRLKTFDNGVSNQGCLRVWENHDAPTKARCLILGDSFGTNLAQSLSSVFQKVIYAYRPAGFDPVLRQMLLPDYVILQITQRFLHGVPDRSATIFDTAAKKIMDMPAAEREVIADQLRNFAHGRNADLANEHLTRLETAMAMPGT